MAVFLNFFGDGRKTMRDEGEDLRQAGRDEMNLAEYPITWFRDLPGVVLETFQGWFGIASPTLIWTYGFRTLKNLCKKN